MQLSADKPTLCAVFCPAVSWRSNAMTLQRSNAMVETALDSEAVPLAAAAEAAPSVQAALDSQAAPEAVPLAAAPPKDPLIPALWTQSADLILGCAALDPQKAVQALEQKYDELDLLSGAETAKGKPEDPLQDISDAKAKEKLQAISAAIEQGGTFNMQSGIINAMWRDALKANPELEQEFKALGRGYTMQRQFKLRWLKEAGEKIKTEAKRIQSNTSEDFVNGIYLPMTRIWKEEGKDEAAKVATLNYVNSCVAMQRVGKTVNGRPLIEYNTMTKRNEFLYLKKTCRDGIVDQRVLEEVWSQKQQAPDKTDIKENDPYKTR